MKIRSIYLNLGSKWMKIGSRRIVGRAGHVVRVVQERYSMVALSGVTVRVTVEEQTRGMLWST